MSMPVERYYKMKGGGDGGLPYPPFWLPFDDMGNGQVNIDALGKAGIGTLTRTTIATTISSIGRVIPVGIGVARSCYDPTTLTYLGYFAEGQRTNSMTFSEDFTNAAWTDPTADATVTANAVTAPDGNLTADLLIDNSAGAAQRKSQVFTVADDSNSHMGAVWVQQGNFPVCAIRLTYTGGVSVDSVVTFTFATQALAISSGAPTNLVAKAFPGGWYRISMVLANNTSGNVNGRFTVFPTSTTITDQGQTAFWGATVEMNALSPSSYMPTAGAIVTRNTDALAYPSAGNTNNTAGLIYAEVRRDFVDPGSFGWLGTSTGGLNRIEAAFETNTYKFTVGDGGSLPAVSFGSVGYGVTHKQVCRYFANGMSEAVDGTLQTAAVVPAVLWGASFMVGTRSAGSSPFFGFIRNLKIWPTSYSDAQAQNLSR